MKRITLELPDDEAMALAQLTKRIGYDDCERLSDRHDGGAERDLMLARRRQAAARIGRSRIRTSITNNQAGPAQRVRLLPSPSQVEEHPTFGKITENQGYFP